jgi:hypothetical protein
MSEPMFLTLNEVVERYRGRDGTLRNWRSMRVRPSFLMLGKTVLYRLRSSIGGIAEISTSVGPSEHS